MRIISACSAFMCLWLPMAAARPVVGDEAIPLFEANIISQIEVAVDEQFKSLFQSELRLFVGDKYDEAEIKKAEQTLQILALELGFLNATIATQSDCLRGQQWFVRFEVNLGEATLIDSLHFKGKTELLRSELLDLLDMKKGDRFDQRVVTRGLFRIEERLIERGFWHANVRMADVVWHANKTKVEINFEVDAGPNYRVEMSGVRFFTARDIKSRALDLVKKNGLTERMLDQLRYQLVAIYRKVGFENVEIHFSEHSVLDKDGMHQVLSIQVEEGKQVLVEDIHIGGGNFVPNDELKLKIVDFLSSRLEANNGMGAVDRYDIDELLSGASFAKKAQAVQILGDISMPDGGLPYDAHLFGEAKERLREFYSSIGFLDARVIGPKVTYSSHGHFARVVYQVVEGKRTLIQKVELIADVPTPLTQLVSEPSLRSGQPLNSRDIESLRTLIEQSLWDTGYPFAHVESEIVRGSNGADVIYRAILGDKITISAVEILGNRVTRQEVILQRLAISAGDEFSFAKISRSRSRLMQTDLFGKVDIYLDSYDEGDHRRRLVVEVEERRRTAIEMGVGASLEEGPRLIGVLYRRNLFGLGMGLKTRAQINYPALFYRIPFFYSAQVTRALEDRFTLAEPWMRPFLFTEGKVLLSLEYPGIAGIPVDTDTSIDLSAAREIRPAYNLNRFALQLSAAITPIKWFYLSPRAEIEYANFNCPEGYRMGQGCGDGSWGARRLDAGAVTQVTLKLLTSIDRRDSPINPRQGYLLELSGDLGLGGGDLDAENARIFKPIQYIRIVGAASWYVPLARRLVWNINAKVGDLFDFATDGFVPLFKRFYLGGTNTVRGFAEDQILPADDDNWPSNRSAPIDVNKPALSLGGNFFTVLRNEIRFPIAGDVEGAVFVDFGELLRIPANWSFSALSMGTGFGIRYQTPIGPLMFDIGVRVFDGNRSLSPSFWNLLGFHFSIGYS